MATPSSSRQTCARILVGLSVTSLGLFALPVPSTQAQALPPFAPGEVLVQFRAGAPAARQQGALHRIGAALRERLPGAIGAPAGAGVLRIATNRPVPDAVRLLRADPAVAFAEPNWVVRHQAVSNDPAFTGGYLWGMYGNASTPANPYGSQAAEAWAAGHTGSSSVYVGVIDEGIDLNHADLAANVWTNPFDPPGGGDDDGNGYVDDAHGWDFWHNDNSVYDGGDADGCGDHHGTHVAGTIGAVGGNGVGVVGVNWSVTLISGKFLGPAGGYISDAIRAVDYFTDLKTRHGLNIVALNNSWSGGGYSQAMHDAIIRAAKRGILFVAAAGNSGTNNDRRASYPGNYNTAIGTKTESGAGYDAVIAVAAIQSNGAMPRWSSYGAKTVDLGAPGASIASTTPNNTYTYFSGTSMATSHVTGGAAFYASTHAGASAASIRSAILSAAVPTPSLAKKTVTGGRLNVEGF